MKFPALSILTVLTLISAHFATAEDLGKPHRTWVSADGNRSFWGEYVSSSVEDQSVTIRREGTVATYPAKAFSQSDKDWLGRMHQYEEGAKLAKLADFSVIQILPNGVLVGGFAFVQSNAQGETSTETKFDGVHFIEIETDKAFLRVGKSYQYPVLPRDDFNYTSTDGTRDTVQAWQPLAVWKMRIFGGGAEDKENEEKAPAGVPLTNASGFLLSSEQVASIVDNVKSQGAISAAIALKDDSVNLAFQVPHGTTKEQAKKIGDNFVRLTMTLSNDDDPGKDLPKGKFSYMVGAFTPDENWLVMGHKREGVPKITW